MPDIRFTIHTECDNVEPSRVVPVIHGDILEYEDDSDEELRIGTITAYVVQRGRAMNEGESIFEAMDSISASTRECCEAILDQETEEWKDSVERFYSDEIPSQDLLYIHSIELVPAWRGKEVGAQVVRTLIATFGSNCGLVVCKPFALQYSNWQAAENEHIRKSPGFETRRLADFARVEKFWFDLGFRKLAGSDFYSFAPHLTEQPSPPSNRRGPRVN